MRRTAGLYSSVLSTHTCRYCGLVFSGNGFCADGERYYCCSGCYLVERILGAGGEQGVPAWIALRLGLGAFLAMNVMMLALVLYIHTPEELGADAVSAMRIGMLVLSTPALVILGGPFALGALRDLRRRRLSTDALIVTGAFAAYGVSAAHTIRGAGHVYFDTATMLLAIVTLGRLLEASAKNRTAGAIRQMLELVPDTARVVRDGQEVEIATSEVREGDTMIVRPGERIPADGEIETGECSVEESAFTGEALPRSCVPGDFVYGGSVNSDGLIRVRAVAAGTFSVAQQIRALVRQAQQERAPAERLADRISAVFVPAVWLTALAAALYWSLGRGDLEQAGLSSLAVLVVACPCAMGLATPMAACLALGMAARVGVLVRSGAVLERIPAIRIAFFDKTGTLTEGRLKVARILAADGSNEEEILTLAASVEAGSEHAVARAITEEAQRRGISAGELSDFRAMPGRGVEGTVLLNGGLRRVVAGSRRLIGAGYTIPPGLASLADESDLSVVYVAAEERVLGIICLADEVRPEAQSVVEALKDLGIRIALFSGDRERPTKQTALRLGIEQVHHECDPLEKAKLVREARKLNTVAAIGDGINDAAALAEADVGIATGSSTDLAREAGGVVLLGSDLSRIPWLILHARKACAIIRQNLWWAFGYNSVAIVLAFMGYVHPLIAACAMLASSLCVIANSSRLARGVED